MIVGEGLRVPPAQSFDNALFLGGDIPGLGPLDSTETRFKDEIIHYSWAQGLSLCVFRVPLKVVGWFHQAGGKKIYF